MAASIVCGVDGSPGSQAALRVAAGLADQLGITLILAHVAELAHVPYAAAYPFGGLAGATVMTEETDSEKEAAARLLERVAVEAGLGDAERRVEIGHPAERLADLADEEDADLILGSVSYNLVGIARCPVLIVPAGASETSEALAAELAADS
jgi:nucleotide-binding universal stress UspA family protein